MKIKLFVFIPFLLLCQSILHSQSSSPTFIDMVLLKSIPMKANAEVYPKYDGEVFFYASMQTGKKAFASTFEEAYPFMGKGALIKKNKLYGVIDEFGNFLLKPTFKSYEQIPFNPTCILFKKPGEKALIYNLKKGAIAYQYITSVEEGLFPYKIEKGMSRLYGVKDIKNHWVLSPKYDAIEYIHNRFYIVRKGKTLELIANNGEPLLPITIKAISYEKSEKLQTNKTIGVKVNEQWDYYKISNTETTKILSSVYACYAYDALQLPKAVGIFKINEKYNILFEDGSTLKNYFDWISENGLIAKTKERIYLLQSNGSALMYYSK